MANKRFYLIKIAIFVLFNATVFCLRRLSPSLSTKAFQIYWIILLSLCFTPAQAEWSGNIRFLSDYIYRGYSKSRGNPVIQGHVDYMNNAGWFTGLDFSQVRFDDQLNADRACLEIKPYVGWNFSISEDWRTDLSVSGYTYDDKIFNHNANYAEFYASVHYQDWFSARASVAPNAYQRQVSIANYELNYRRDLSDAAQFSVGLGYNQASALLGQNYFYWNVGTSWFMTSYLTIDLRYVDVEPNFHQIPESHHDEFYPRQQDNNYLFSITFGF